MALNSQIGVSATTMVRGLAISISSELISKVTTLPLGIQWRIEDNTNSVITKKNFITADEKHIEDKNGVRRESLSYPWDKGAYHILKYILCEGRLSVVYVYHFRLLHEVTFREELPQAQRLSVPYFLL